MTTVYEGDCEVEDNDFPFQFKKLILRENEVAVEGDGQDEDGPFEFEGILSPIANGPFYGPITVIYPTCAPEQPGRGEDVWTGTAYLSIKLGLPQKEEGRNVKGTWIQDGEEWNFCCELTPLLTA